MESVLVALLSGCFGILIVVLKNKLDSRKTVHLECLSEEEKIKHLLKHHLFARFDYWINIKIPKIKSNNPRKEMLIRKALSVKMKTCREIIKQEVISTQSECPARCDFVTRLFTAYEEAWKLAGVPDCFVFKFREWHSDRMTEAYYQYERLLDSSFYTDMEKKIAILDMWCYLFNWTMIDAEKTLHALNGDLDKALLEMESK